MNPLSFDRARELCGVPCDDSTHDAVVADYLAHAERFYTLIAAGRGAAGGVVVDREVLAERARDSGGVRTFLTDQFEAFTRVGGAREFVAALCSTEPDSAAEVAAGMAAEVTVDGRRRTATFRIQGCEFDAALGGPMSPIEMWRTFSLEVSHATWRDRPARRLLAVSAVAGELVPDPARFRARIAEATTAS